MEAFVQILAEKKVDVGSLITHRFSVERAKGAYDLITGKSHEPVFSRGGDSSMQQPKASCRALRLFASGQPSAIRPAAQHRSSPSGLLGAGVFASWISQFPR